MPVNESDEALMLFVQRHKDKFIDEEETLGDLEEWDDDEKQSSSVHFNSSPDNEIKVGDIVRINYKGERIIATITKEFKVGDGSERFKAQPLNSSDVITIAPSAILDLSNDPAYIPHKPNEVDTTALSNVLTQSDLDYLWSPNSDNTISEESRLALYWHQRLRCAPLRHLQRLAKRGVIPKCIVSIRKMPLCAFCAFAAAHKRPWRTKGSTKRHIRKVWQRESGSGTSCDHIVSHQPGLIPQTSGKLTHARFWGSVIYVDHATDFIYNHLIKTTSSDETLASKFAYERLSRSYGVTIGAYDTDNSRFNDERFTGSCKEAGQQLTFCGVGAHHQNAIAERKIKEICYGGRTILLHAKRRWPSMISTVLWPFVVRAVVDRHNRLSLDQNGKSPVEKFVKTDDEIRPEDFHTWGCPAYVLAAQNQSGTIGTPKWEPRANAGIYLGRSPSHAGNVALILSLCTGLVSPQYHVVFDDDFSTVAYLDSSDPPPNWPEIVRQHREVSTNFRDDKLNMNWLYPSSIPTTDANPIQTARSLADIDVPNQLISHTTQISTATASEGDRNTATNMNASPISEASTTIAPNIEVSQGDGGEATESLSSLNLDSLGLRRSKRIRALKMPRIVIVLP